MTSDPPAPPPKLMKVAVATGFGSIDENIEIRDDWPVPSDIPKGCLLIRVLACALAPGDVRVLSGATDFVQLPKGGHPYVIGSDVSGKVVATHKNEAKFSVGDCVVSRFALPAPVGGCSEYRLVEAKLTEHCPPSISPVVACGLTASAVAAKKIVTSYVRQGDRVLVIGGSGGVGTSVLQYCRPKAAYLAAVSTQEELCKKLGADEVIDYRTTKWWEVPEYENDPFDVVIDLVSGDNWTCGGCAGTAVKPKGIYAAIMPGVASQVVVHGVWDLTRLSLEWLAITLRSRLNRRLPKWAMVDGLDLKDGEIAGVLQDVLDGRLKPVLDPSSPFPFTTVGVREAMKLQKSCHAHGKVVIEIEKE